MTPNIVIFDLDGTLANVKDRVPLLDGTFVGFHRFHSACIDDTLNSKAAEVAKVFNREGYAFWVATGRPIEMEAATRYWFHAYCLVPDRILMRPVGDVRTAAEIKRAWVRDGTIPKERVLCVFDDRAADVAMWWSEGLTCFTVAPCV